MKQVRSEVQPCPHCGNRSAMPTLASANHRLGYWEDCGGGDGSYVDEGVNLYRLYICEACGDPILVCSWRYDVDGNGSKPFETIYPQQRSYPQSVPKNVLKALHDADSVRKVNPNAFGVMATRALELIALHQECGKPRLVDSIKSLLEKKVIPERLATLAQELRLIRNHAAHGVDLTAAEVPVVDAVLSAVVEYIYAAPELLERAERCRQTLDAKEQHRKLGAKATSSKASSE